MPYVNGIMANMVDTPELKVTPSGKHCCNFTVANNYRYGDEKKTDFIRCSAFGKTAEAICKYIKKGEPFIIQGEFHNRPYRKNDNGYDIPNWQFTVSSIVFVPKSKVENTSSEFTEIEYPKDESATNKKDLPDFEDVDTDTDLPF